MQKVNGFADQFGLLLSVQKGKIQERAGLDAWLDDATTDHGTSSGDEKSLASCDWSPVSDASMRRESFVSRESLLSSCDWSSVSSPHSMDHENCVTADPLVPSPSSPGSRRSALREAGMGVLASLNKGIASFERPKTPKTAQRGKRDVQPCHQQKVDVAAQVSCGKFTKRFAYFAQTEELSQAVCGQFPEDFNSQQQPSHGPEASSKVEPRTVDFSPEPGVLMNFIKERSAHIAAKDMPLKVQSEVFAVDKQASRPLITVGFETPANIQPSVPEKAPRACELDPSFPFKIRLSEFLLEEQPSGGFN